MRSREVTLRDVADHAGVSTRTVSNVVNDFLHVSPAMRERVQTSLRELNYRPNLLARSLRSGRTGMLTLLLPFIDVPYFGELAHQLVEQATELGCTVMIDETGGDVGEERRLLESAARSRWVDGVLLSPLGLQGADLAGLASSVPVVLLGERTANTAFDHVGIDNVLAASEAVRHLIEGGRTSIVAVGGSDTPSDATTQERLRGYHQGFHAGPLAGTGEHWPTPDYSWRSGAQAVADHVDRRRPPDALFCLSDELASGALRALHTAGLRVPDDVALVGFDDVEASSYLVPSLTSVRPDRAGIARSALELLLDRIAGGRGPLRDVRAGHRLVVRESSLPGG